MAGSIVTVIWLALVVVFIAAGWIIFQKAGKAGWMAIIPILNIFIMLKIVGRPAWWFILLLIPIVNIIVEIIIVLDLSRSFGHGAGFAIGLILLAPIFYLILAFGGSRYVGPAGAGMMRAPSAA